MQRSGFSWREIHPHPTASCTRPHSEKSANDLRKFKAFPASIVSGIVAGCVAAAHRLGNGRPHLSIRFLCSVSSGPGCCCSGRRRFRCRPISRYTRAANSHPYREISQFPHTSPFPAPPFYPKLIPIRRLAAVHTVSLPPYRKAPYCELECPAHRFVVGSDMGAE